MAAQTRILIAHRLLTIGHSYKRSHRRPPSPVPYLRLRGYWLMEAGFAVGQRVRVDVVDGCITITPTQETSFGNKGNKGGTEAIKSNWQDVHVDNLCPIWIAVPAQVTGINCLRLLCLAA